jgi:uncharacterized damage-inducible protein DinB
VRPWFERRFRFDHLDPGDFPFLLERIAGAPARVEEKTRSLPASLLTRRAGDAWSIQEHVGHLHDLDLLHDARLEDYSSGAAALRAADLQNRRTYEARHNERALAEITSAFRAGREALVARLEAWPAERITDSAQHPRLRQPMRLLDMVYFAAEHDDHHLRTITELARITG